MNITEGLEAPGPARPFPGTLETIQRNSKLEISTWDGFVVDLTKVYSGDDDSSMQIAQNITLGRTDLQSKDKSSYHFVATFVNGARMMQGVVLPDAVVACAAADRLAEGWDYRIDAQLTGDPSRSMLNGKLSHHGDDYSADIKVGHGSGMGLQLGMAYLQAVTRELSVGIDFNYIGAYKKLDYTVLGSYAPQPDRAYIGMFHPPTQTLTAMYKQRLDERITFFADLGIANDAQQQTLVANSAAGLEYNLRLENAGVNPRTGKPEFIPYTVSRLQVNSDGKVSTTLEQLALGGMAKLKVSAAMDHSTNTYNFGFGMEVQY